MEKDLKVLIIRTIIDQNNTLINTDIMWQSSNRSRIDNGNLFSAFCPTCDEPFILNVSVESEIKEELESEIIETEDGTWEIEKIEEEVEYNDYQVGEELPEVEEHQEIAVPKKQNRRVEEEENEPLFECHICSEKFNSPYTLRIHRNIHTDKFKCRICSTRFIKGERLKHHMKNHHTHEEQALAKDLEKDDFNEKASKLIELPPPPTPKERGTLCPICGKHFSSTTSFFTHSQHAHQKRSYECDYCGKVLRTRVTLKHHFIRSHTDKINVTQLYRCAFCPAVYFLKRDLYMHLRAKHVPKEKTFVCEICQEAFIYKRELLDHHRVMHQDSSQGRYKCEICHRTFNRLATKKEHLVIHTGERNFECLFCGQRYKRKSYLKIHERIHTGYRPYKCQKEECNASFYDCGSYKQHQKKHEKQDQNLNK